MTDFGGCSASQLERILGNAGGDADPEPSASWQSLLADAANSYAREQGEGALSREEASAAFLVEAGLAVGRAVDARVPVALELPRRPPPVLEDSSGSEREESMEPVEVRIATPIASPVVTPTEPAVPAKRPSLVLPEADEHFDAPESSEDETHGSAKGKAAKRKRRKRVGR